jgi:hypothetical protein
MERSRKVPQGVAGRLEEIKAVGPDDMVLLGSPRSSSASALHPKADAVRPSGRVTAANVLRLLEYQEYRCALTGRALTPETASLDHIMPVRCGGEHVIENAQVLHKDVNRAKSTMTTEEFIELCRAVVAHADSSRTLELRRSA